MKMARTEGVRIVAESNRSVFRKRELRRTWLVDCSIVMDDVEETDAISFSLYRSRKTTRGALAGAPVVIQACASQDVNYISAWRASSRVVTNVSTSLSVTNAMAAS